MAKKILTRTEISEYKKILDDESKSFEARKVAAEKIKDREMNPLSDEKFDPETFDPMYDVKNYDVLKRPRVKPPKRFPNMHGLKPKEIKDGQMVGMFESKQDLYLLICELSERIADLEEEFEELKNK